MKVLRFFVAFLYDVSAAGSSELDALVQLVMSHHGWVCDAAAVAAAAAQQHQLSLFHLSNLRRRLVVQFDCA